jgi:hypothetical protein
MPESRRVKRWRVVDRDHSYGVSILVVAVVIILMIAVVWLLLLPTGEQPR